MVAQFTDGPQSPGVPETFNAVLRTAFDGFELNNPMIPPPEQIITLDEAEDYTVSGLIPSSIILANQGGGSTITFNNGSFATEPKETRRSIIVYGFDYTIIANGISFSVKDSPTLLIGSGTIGWRAVNTNSDSVSREVANRVFDKQPASFGTDLSDAEEWVEDQIRRYIKIDTYGFTNRYQKVIDGPDSGNAPDVSYPAPPLQSGVTTVTIQAWKKGVHRVNRIPSGTAAASIEIDLSDYTTDLTESGETSSTYVHFENREVNSSIPFTFVGMPSGMSWAIDPSDIFGSATQQTVTAHYAFRIDRVGNQLIPIAFCISPT